MVLATHKMFRKRLMVVVLWEACCWSVGGALGRTDAALFQEAGTLSAKIFQTGAANCGQGLTEDPPLRQP